MSEKEVVDTVRGKYHKFDIVRDSGGVFGKVKFYILRDGKPFKGPYSSLADAFEAATDEG